MGSPALHRRRLPSLPLALLALLALHRPAPPVLEMCGMLSSSCCCAPALHTDALLDASTVLLGASLQVLGHNADPRGRVFSAIWMAAPAVASIAWTILVNAREASRVRLRCRKGKGRGRAVRGIMGQGTVGRPPLL